MIPTDPLDDRFIPTYMGNTCAILAPLLLDAVHPHVHGEHLDRRSRLGCSVGSSPRTWGTRNRQGKYCFRERFIPTYMGNTPRHRRNSRSCSVHPHVHGEHTGPGGGASLRGGSSPRTWGTPGIVQGIPGTSRFIPTYMGNTLIRAMTRWRRTVHPHVHGEHMPSGTSFCGKYGSSPRTWGTPCYGDRWPARNRFIPTYMGNTPSRAPGPL